MAIAQLLVRAAIVGPQLQHIAGALFCRVEFLHVAPRNGKHVVDFGLAGRLQVFPGEHQQFCLGVTEACRADQVFSNRQAIVVWAIGPVYQPRLRQKSYDRRRPTVRGRFVTTFGVKFCVST